MGMANIGLSPRGMAVVGSAAKFGIVIVGCTIRPIRWVATTYWWTKGPGDTSVESTECAWTQLHVTAWSLQRWRELI